MPEKLRKVVVGLGARSYRIIIGPGALDAAGGLMAQAAKRALVVTNRRVERLHGARLAESMAQAGLKWERVILPEGEERKNMASVARVHDALVRGGYGRDCLVAGFGGGVVGDVAGFAAATYMRGVKMAQIPTTLLAQVDSSVGGKTGVNHPAGKNLIGAFHQPCLVVADTAALATLPKAEVLCGVAEIIKYGAIASEKFFRFLERNIEKLVDLEPDTVARVVGESCRIKAEVVASDEFETGRRAILNFGHTVGHAIEAVTGYKRYRHGYAVAIGMVAAAGLSVMRRGLKAGDAERIKALIRRAGLPSEPPGDVRVEALLKAMEMDKKVKAGRIRFALLSRLGECASGEDVTADEIRRALDMAGK